MSEEAEKKTTLQRLFSDLEQSRKIEVEYLGDNYEFEYMILGSEMEKIQEKHMDYKDLQKSVVKVDRKVTWAMLAKANPSEYTPKAYERFPTDLLDIISRKILENEKMYQEDFPMPSTEGDLMSLPN